MFTASRAPQTVEFFRKDPFPEGTTSWRDGDSVKDNRNGDACRCVPLLDGLSIRPKPGRSPFHVGRMEVTCATNSPRMDAHRQQDGACPPERRAGGVRN